MLFTWMLNVRSSTRTQTSSPLFSVHFASHFVFIYKFFFLFKFTAMSWTLKNGFSIRIKSIFSSLSYGSIFFCNWFFAWSNRKYTFWLMLLFFFVCIRCRFSICSISDWQYCLCIVDMVTYFTISWILFCFPSVLCNQKICNSSCFFGLTKWRLSYLHHWFCVVHFMLFILLGLFFLLSIYLNSKIHK